MEAAGIKNGYRKKTKNNQKTKDYTNDKWLLKLEITVQMLFKGYAERLGEINMHSLFEQKLASISTKRRLYVKLG